MNTAESWGERFMQVGWISKRQPSKEGQELGVLKGPKESFPGCSRGPGRRVQGKPRGRRTPDQLESRGHGERFSFYCQ